MLQKLKDLMKIKEGIDDIKSDFRSFSKEIPDLKKDITSLSFEIDALKKNFSDLDKAQAASSKKLESSIAKIQGTEQDFVKEINDFRLQKTQMQKSLHESAESELKSLLERIRTDVSRYNDLKNSVQDLSSDLKKAEAEIKKFMQISQKLRPADFEASKFAKKIFDEDKNKLELLKKIDSLQRLIARQRRNQ